ncbi:hypothetical protein T492DRAFT_878040 [Pavlovales sp. CCMP2436]|nr:hypothetical protein T492DRAFT_878040 [Pavlovales sp. CCMP2436]
MESGANSADGNLLALSLECARADATVGEISNALEDAWGRYQPAVSLQSGVYLSEWASVAKANEARANVHHGSSSTSSSGSVGESGGEVEDAEISLTRAAAAEFEQR